MELQRQQDMILTEIGTKIFEEDENVDDAVAVHDKSTTFRFDMKYAPIGHSRKCLEFLNNAPIG